MGPSVEIMREAARNGHKRAQFDLGIAYLEGIGIEPNHVNGVRWLRKASIGKNPMPEAMLKYALCLRNGIGCEIDIDESKKMAAEAKNKGLQVARAFLSGLEQIRKDKDGCYILPTTKAQDPLPPKGSSSSQRQPSFSKNPPPRTSSRRPPPQRQPPPQRPPPQRPQQQQQPMTRLERMRAAAKEGNKRAQYDIGCTYIDGMGVEANPTNGVRWLHKACKGAKALPEAKMRYAICLFEGIGCEVDIDAARLMATEAKVAGASGSSSLLKKIKSIKKDKDGCYILDGGISSAKPQSIPQNNRDPSPEPPAPEDLPLPRDSVEVEEQHEIAVAEVVDQQIETSPEDSEMITPADVRKLFMDGMSCVGGLYEGKSEHDGFLLLMKAAKVGHAGSRLQVARCFKDGIGCRKNKKNAKKWAKMAAADGSKKAADLLAELDISSEKDVEDLQVFGQVFDSPDLRVFSTNVFLEDMPLDIETIESHFLKGFSIFGKSAASFIVGTLFLFGAMGFPTDASRAAELFTVAAGEGNTSAKQNIGICYLLGHGVDRDLCKAIEYLKDAANNGSGFSALVLSICYRTGCCVSRDEREADKFYKLSRGNDDEELDEDLAVKLVESSVVSN